MKTLQCMTRLALRGFSTGARFPVAAAASNKVSYGQFPSSERYAKIQKNQKFFCEDDGNLVWQKRGFSDDLIYKGMLIFMFVGLGLTFYRLGVMALPPKN